MQVLPFYLIFTLVYGLASLYIFRRADGCFRQTSRRRLKYSFRWFYWILAFSYPVGRFGAALLPKMIADTLIWVGSYWLGVVFYSFGIVLLLDLIRLADRFLHFLPRSLYANPARTGMAAAAAIVLVVSYGIWNAAHPVIRHYDITIHKASPAVQELRIIAVSDIHLGKIIGAGRLQSLVNTINEHSPDLVLLPGDMIDENVDYFAEQHMPEIFRTLKATYGVFACLGNHEYIGRNSETAIDYLSQAGITVLRDRWTELPPGIIIAGRDDRSSPRTTGHERAPLVTLLQGADRTLPIILLDHQPFHLEEAEQAGVDLQLSGHTHQGQLFPNNLITHRMYEVDWGYLQKGALQVIVSCGYGTWGPPLRVGNTPEIVEVMVHFRK